MKTILLEKEHYNQNNSTVVDYVLTSLESCHGNIDLSNPQFHEKHHD